MEGNCAAKFGFLVKISLLLLISVDQFSVKATKTPFIEPCVGRPLNYDQQSNSSDRIAQVEARSHEQEKDISTLKNIVDEDRKIINQLTARVVQLEASSVAKKASSVAGTTFFGRAKRPARLLPPSVFRKKENRNRTENENTEARFYGPPSSCSELGKLGYTLNGYYLVNNVNEEPNNIKFEVVECRFKHPPGTNQKTETRLGFLKLDSPTSNPTSSPLQTQKPSSKSQSNKAYDRISHLKNLKGETCLTLNRPGPETILNGRLVTSPLLFKTSPCLNDKKWQQWIFKHGTHICLMDGRIEEDCLTVTSSGALSIDSYVQTSSRQQWTFDDEKNQLVNVHSNLCLSDSSTDNPTNDSDISLVKVVRCDKLDKGQEWSFEPLSVNNNSLKSAKNLTIPEKKNGKKVRLQK